MKASLTKIEKISSDLHDFLFNPMFNYQNAYRKISKVHTFNFNLKKNFTSRQKSAITKAAQKYLRISELMDKKFFSLIPFSKTKKLKGFKKQFHHSLKHTNKGYIFPRGKFELKYSPSSKEYSIHSIYEERRDVFVPLPRYIYSDPSSANDWIQSQFAKRHQYGKFTVMSVSIKGKKSAAGYMGDESEEYLPEIIGSLQKENEKNPINGVYFSFFTPKELSVPKESLSTQKIPKRKVKKSTTKVRKIVPKIKAGKTYPIKP